MSVEMDVRHVLEKVRDGYLGAEEGLSVLRNLIGDVLPELVLFSAIDDVETGYRSVAITHLELIGKWREAAPAPPKAVKPKRLRNSAAIIIIGLALSQPTNHINSSGAATPLSSPAL